MRAALAIAAAAVEAQEPDPEIFAGERQRLADQLGLPPVRILEAPALLLLPELKMGALGPAVVGDAVQPELVLREGDQPRAELLIKDASSPRNSTSCRNSQPNSSLFSSLKTASAL